MKKAYDKIEMEIILFDKRDIVTASDVVVIVEHDNAYYDFSSFYAD